MSTQLHRSIETVLQHLKMIEDQDLSKLDFTWLGVNFTALVEKKQASTLITLKGNLGRLYYTVENAAKRRDVLSNYYASKKKRHKPFQLIDRQNIHFNETTQANSLLDQAGIMSALTFILLDNQKTLLDYTENLKPVS